MDRTSQGSWEFYTPRPYVEIARLVMGGIDLDPASCEAAQRVVNADIFLTAADDGLSCIEHWSGRLFVNPPGGGSPDKWSGVSRSYQAVWWWAVSHAWQTGLIEQAVFLSFSIELFSVAQRIDCPQPMDFPFVVPAGRIAFDEPDGAGGRRETTSPKYANALIWLPPKGHSGIPQHALEAAAEQCGVKARGPLANWVGR